MRKSNEVLRIGLASASLSTVGYPVISGVLTGSLLLSYLLPQEARKSDDVDNVTGLLCLDAYKKFLNETMLKEIETPKEHRRIYVVSLDVLGFTDINKEYGYSAGRRCVRQIARIINQQGKVAFAARPFADVFLLAYVVDSIDEVENNVFSLIEEIEGYESTLGFVINLCSGITELQLSDDEGVEVDVVSSAITQAEIARLIGKRNAVKINHYKKEYARKEVEKIKMEDALIRSIENDEISVYYQPKIFTERNSVAGFEALCRWYHKELGFISPAFFIPLSEETGFIHKLGSHVIEQSCKLMKALKEEGYYDVSFAVNISITQLEHLDGKPFFNHLKSMIEKYQINPNLLELEITESVAATDFELIKKHVITLRSMGITVSLDDFGTGESSLYRLKELPLNQLKIDKSFVDDVCTEKGAEIMESIFGLAKAMSLTTVAEGVENQEQENKLRQLGCTYLQGYHLGRPMPEEHIRGILQLKEGD